VGRRDSTGATWTIELALAPHLLAIARLVIALGLVVGALSPAAAAALDAAEALYREGDMPGAASLARAQGSAAGFALAAQATLVEATYLSPKSEKQALFERAAADAEAALAHDPKHVDAHLQMAIALGQLAELEDPVSAHVNGYARQGKALIDQALALDPENEWARALLGMWHLRIVERAGDALAESLYGASRAQGIALCSDAIAGPHRALALKYGCARTLLELDPDRFANTAEQTLAAVKEANARDAADRLVQAEAARLLAEIKSGDSE
jgi:hypothetical protein